jgi:hypothetical protein
MLVLDYLVSLYKNDPLILHVHFCLKRFKQKSLYIVMGASHSSEQSYAVEDPKPEPEPEPEPKDPNEITTEEFLENSIKWLCTLS